MEQSGFWNFFFATGLPQAYLAARLREGEEVVFPPMPPPGAPGGRDSAPVCAGHDGQKGYVNCPAGPPSADRPEIHRGADEMHMRTKALVLRAVDYKE